MIKSSEKIPPKGKVSNK